MNTLGLANSRTDLLNETEFRNRSGFFLNVMQRGLSHEAIDNYLYNANIDNKRRYRVAILDFSEKNKVIESRQFEIRQQLTRWFIFEHDWQVLTFSHRQQLVLLIDEQIDTRQFLKRLYDFLIQQPGLHYAFTIGFFKNCWIDSYAVWLIWSANNALKLTSQQHPIMRFRPKNAQELLHLLPKQEARVFVEKRWAQF